MYMYTFAVFHLENKLGGGENRKEKKVSLTCYFSSYKLSAKYLEDKPGMF